MTREEKLINYYKQKISEILIKIEADEPDFSLLNMESIIRYQERKLKGYIRISVYIKALQHLGQNII